MYKASLFIPLTDDAIENQVAVELALDSHWKVNAPVPEKGPMEIFLVVQQYNTAFDCMNQMTRLLGLNTSLAKGSIVQLDATFFTGEKI